MVLAALKTTPMPKVLNLNDCFPEPVDKSVTRGPLPKQSIFLDHALHKPTKFIRYVGGIGSGKSLIGCITVLSWAVQYPGDYLIGRQFMPELRDTTYKTFLEICPPELIVEHKIAEATIKIKSNNGVATIFFRGLEEYDKQRSLNLNGFYIDEANQVAEEAFILLYGRLRGKYVRKGILTQNSGGRDWAWRWFVDQKHISDPKVKAEFANIKAPSTENYHLPKDYVPSMLATWSDARIKREIYADEDSFEGQVYSEFNHLTHVVKPFRIPDGWTRVVGADHGYRNPACWVWAAVDPDDNIYIYREFYESEWLVDEIIRGHKALKRPGVLAMQKGEAVPQVYIDPSVKAKRATHRGVATSNWDEYMEALPEGYPLFTANNDVTSGIDRIKRYMRVDEKTHKPRMYIFDTCVNLIEEMINYRYQELRSTQEGKRNEKELPVKVKDHACDALRYMIMSRPEPTEISKEDIWKRVKYNSLEGRLLRELQSINMPKSGKDPFET